jgi:hypothetical protein
MGQQALYPHILAALVRIVRYKKGWSFWLGDLDRGQNSAGLTLTIQVATTNSYEPHAPLVVNHYFIVPAAAYNLRSWQRWLLSQIMLVELHEAMEFFTVPLGDIGTPEYENKPYAPHHGPGEDPYTVYEHGSDEDVRTSFRGELNDGR